MEIKVYEPHPDVREINFRIVEVCLDMYVLGVHYHRDEETFGFGDTEDEAKNDLFFGVDGSSKTGGRGIQKRVHRTPQGSD